MCDLAGSERVGRTGASGAARLEGEKINTSLLALGNVIHVLTRKSSRPLHVPFRDSSLTRLLQNSLGGNCRTSLIVCVSPALSDLSETRSSLLFGERAMLVRSRLVQNASVDFKSLAEELQQQLALAERKLAEAYLRAETRGARAIQALLRLKKSRGDALASRVDAHALAREILEIELRLPWAAADSAAAAGVPGQLAPFDAPLGPAVRLAPASALECEGTMPPVDVDQRLVAASPVMGVKLPGMVVEATPWHASLAHTVLRAFGCSVPQE